MIKKIFLIFYILLTPLCLLAQQSNPVIFTIDGQPVYKNEVEFAYKKNEENLQEKVSIHDFLQSYIEFKMNVAEAKAERLDTTSNYIRQFESYRMQMAKPYLRDTISATKYVRKMYDRLLENVEVNHLIFPFDKKIVFPADTMPIYERALKARIQILDRGFSDDVIQQTNLNYASFSGLEGKNGYLGWIAPFMLSAELEDIIYSQPTGEISMPVRTLNGYHIIQVLNRRPAIGSAEIEQIMFRFSKIPASQSQVDSVRNVAQKEYDNLRTPADYNFLCEAFSNAYKTGDKGCYFGMVGVESSLSPKFISATFSLREPGDISPPVQSDYGFHIIRLLRKISVPTFEKMESQIVERIKSSNRLYASNQERKQNLIKEMGINVYENIYAKLNHIAINISPRDSAFIQSVTNGEEILVNINNVRSVSVKEFVRYIEYRQRQIKKDPNELQMLMVQEASPYSLSTDILKEYFGSFLTILAEDYKDDTLEDRYSNFKSVVDEFSDGLLAFEVKNKHIWSRAKNDEQGLAKYFAKNKSKYKLDQPRYKGVIIYARDEESLNKAIVIAEKTKRTEDLLLELRNTVNKDSISVKIESGLWIKGDNSFVDHKIYGGDTPPSYEGFPYFHAMGKVIKKPQEYKDVRAEIELDFQKQLEKDWSIYLKDKYKTDINKLALESIE